MISLVGAINREYDFHLMSLIKWVYKNMKKSGNAYEEFKKADAALLERLEERSKKMPVVYPPECVTEYTRELTLFARFRLAGIAVPAPELDELDQCQHKVQPTKK